MSEDELTAFIRENNITFPSPSAESESESGSRLGGRLEALNELIESGAIPVVIEAIESGAIGRKKPGRKPGESKERDALVRAIAQACLNKAGGRSGIAKRTFVERVCAEMHIGRDRADNIWYEVTEAVGRTSARRVR
jgi:hypothetical protein